MEKLTSILAVFEHPEEGEIIFDKAVTLARSFGARIDLLLVDPTQAPHIARLIITRGYDRVKVSSPLRDGESICECILQRLSRSRPDLILKSPAGSRPLRRFSLDANDYQLASECSTPILLVRHRPWSTPLRFAAALDVSDGDATLIARGILHTAGLLAGGCHASLDILYSERDREEPALRMERAVRLAQLVREFHVGCEHIQMLAGEPEKTLPPLAASRQYDVLALGAPTRRQGLGSIFGGMTSRMIEATESDVLLVNASAHGRDEWRASERPRSASEQRADEVEQFV